MAAMEPTSPAQRVHPHNLEAEKAVLGTFFLNERSIAEVQGLLTPEDFYDPRHQEIFRVILDLVERGQPIDPMLLINELERAGMLEKVGGPAYLTGLEQSVISPGNVRHHAEIVHDKALLRRLIHAATEISEEALTERSETQDILTGAEDKIFQIMSGQEAKEFRSIGENALEIYRDLEQRSENRQEVTGITTGLPNLDQLTGGLQKSDLIILAARPSVGKTSLALNFAVAAAESHFQAADGSEAPPGVAVFSLEMNHQQVVHRMVCTKSQIRMDLLRKNRLSEAQLHQFGDTLEQMSNLSIFINDTPGLNPMEMRLHAQRLKTRNPNLALIIVDYLQLMSGSKKTDNRQQEVSDISRALKALARDLNIPVMALSQLSRGIESRRGAEGKPRLSDLRESGAIEQDADVVMFLHRLAERETDKEPTDNDDPSVHLIDLVIAKQRNGPIGSCHLLFREDFTQFVPLAPGYQP